ncbi:MAG: hypothetical protein FJZ13_02815 [Candidatus Omnitrophica bacterium]|nr:hypothetical protein [Candidatus Omnitrophota bacterium]
MAKFKSINNQTPNPNNQIITKHQIPITKQNVWSLVIDYWNLFGDWRLVIGYFVIISHLCFGIHPLAFAQDKIIAIVNSDVITQKDLNDFVNFMRIQLARQYTGKELEDRIQAMEADLVDRLIEDRLILQEAKSVLEEAKKNPAKERMLINQLEVAPTRIKAQINQIKNNYPSDKEFQDTLAEQGITQADIERKIREQALMYNIIELKVKNKIMVNPSEITDFYQNNPQEFKTEEERQVLLMTINDKGLADEVYSKLRAGMSINDVAVKYSLTPQSLSAQRNKEFKKEIEDAIFSLKPAEVSAPLKIDNSFYIFKLEKVIEPRQETLTQAQGQIYNFLFNKKMQEELSKWVDELRAKAYIKVLKDEDNAKVTPKN